MLGACRGFGARAGRSRGLLVTLSACLSLDSPALCDAPEGIEALNNLPRIYELARLPLEAFEALGLYLCMLCRLAGAFALLFNFARGQEQSDKDKAFIHLYAFFWTT